MADLSTINRTSKTRLAGADPVTGAETYWLEVSSDNEAEVVDRINLAIGGTVAVTAGTPVELKVGGSNQAERKLLIFQADGKITWGFASGTLPFRGYKDQYFSIDLGPGQSIFVDAVSGTVNVGVGEGKG